MRPQVDPGKGALNSEATKGRSVDARPGGLGQKVQGPDASPRVTVVLGPVTGDGDNLTALLDREPAASAATGTVAQASDFRLSGGFQASGSLQFEATTRTETYA